MEQPTPVRAFFLSDVHLGSRYSRADKATELLAKYKPEKLFLVGDIVDGWKLQRDFYWRDEFDAFVRLLIKLMDQGTTIYYIAGNHDDFLRHFLPLHIGCLHFGNEFIHETKEGQKLLVIHGDNFDVLTKHWVLINKMGDMAYSTALWVNSWFNWFFTKMGMEYWSLSAYLKHNIKQAVNYINNFEEIVAKYTKKHNCNGVVCGHIHTPVIKDINGVTYYNCGDWVESLTALVEDHDGNISLISHT